MHADTKQAFHECREFMANRGWEREKQTRKFLNLALKFTLKRELFDLGMQISC
jgi:hypothetical protein